MYLTWKQPKGPDQREHLRQLAKDTLSIVENGWYISPSGRNISIRRTVEDSLKGTLFYNPEAWDRWETNKPEGESFATQFRIREVTTLDAAREFAYELRRRAIDSGSSTCPTVGVLNFASATKPGGGFLNGAKAQEESIARVSSLYLSLTTPTGLQFYKSDVRKKEGPAYSHAMVYSPAVVVFNSDDGTTLEEPYEISILTSPAVNAGVVRNQNRHQDEGKVERAITRLMKQRMGRILAAFENRGDRWLVLGSFGTGVFQNSVETVAGIWADLLLREDSRFYGVFERIDFAIIGRDTFERFSSALQAS
ncbi:hypothetical protein CPB86DRAFT_772735 [Serendipita vermifera]|nr:hypothetical protein CPB86DRAFT_772735 [Serendipita vermifera]